MRRALEAYQGLAAAAVRSIFLHKLRSALSILGVVCGVMAVLTMISIGEGARKEVLEGLRKLGTTHIYVRPATPAPNQGENARDAGRSGLTRLDAERIRRNCPQVVAVAAATEFSAAVFAPYRQMSPPVVASSADYARMLGLSMREGRFIKQMDIDRGAQVCVLGGALADQMPEAGRIGAHLRIGGHVFTVVGRLGQNSWDPDVDAVVSRRNTNERLFIPLGLERLFPESPGAPGGAYRPDAGRVSELVVRVKSESDVPASAAIIRRILEVAHGGGSPEILVPSELLAEARKTRRTFSMVLFAVAGISLLVGGIGVMNIMLASVSERTREIGIRRAVGASRGDIVAQFLTESVLMTLIGGIIGVLLGVGAVCLISMAATWEMLVNAWAVLLPLGLSVGVGLFFGLFPAVQAARMEPMAALRR